MAKPFQITFDAHDAAAQATFWAEALGYIVQPPPEGTEILRSRWADGRLVCVSILQMSAHSLCSHLVHLIFLQNNTGK